MQKIYYQQDCNLQKLDGKTVATGETVHCFFDGGRPAVIAERFPALYEAMQATMNA